MNLIPKTFPPKFADVLSNDFSNPRWYMPFNLDSMMSEKQQQEQKFQDILVSFNPLLPLIALNSASNDEQGVCET